MPLKHIQREDHQESQEDTSVSAKSAGSNDVAKSFEEWSKDMLSIRATPTISGSSSRSVAEHAQHVTNEDGEKSEKKGKEDKRRYGNERVVMGRTQWRDNSNDYNNIKESDGNN
ncbi:MAG: hypothetical protein Q9226_008774, partial [Calogaya cf. arnoldii]